MSNGGGVASYLLFTDNKTYTLEDNIIGIIKVSLLVVIVFYIFWKLKKNQLEEKK